MDHHGMNGAARAWRTAARVGPALLLLGMIAVPWARAVAGEPPGDPGAGRLLVADGERGLLRIFELPSRALLATLNVGSAPVAMAAAPDGRTAWVADRDAATLTVVDLEALRVARTLPMEGIDRPCSLATADHGRWLLVGGETGRRFVQLAADRSVITQAMTTSEEGPHQLAAARRGARAFIANEAAGSVTQVRAGPLRIGGHWPIGARPGALAAGPHGKRLIVALREQHAVLVMDGDGRELARQTLPGEPRGVAILPSGTHALVAIGTPAGLVSIDLQSLQAGQVRLLEGTPEWIVTDDAGTRAYAAGRDADAVVIVSMPDGEVIGRIDTGPGTSSLAWASGPAPHGKGRKR